MIRLEIPISRDLLEQMGLGSPNLSVEWDIQREMATIVLYQGSEIDKAYFAADQPDIVLKVGEEERRSLRGPELRTTWIDEISENLYRTTQVPDNLLHAGGPSYDLIRQAQEGLRRSFVSQNITGAVETERLTEVRDDSNPQPSEVEVMGYHRIGFIHEYDLSEEVSDAEIEPMTRDSERFTTPEHREILRRSIQELRQARNPRERE